MCGITGFSGKGSSSNLTLMTNALIHRGPDEGNIYIKNNVGLGHRRLSIIDLEFGHQPMIDEKTGLVIVYNGEIYNHPEIRDYLKKNGHIFKTKNSDTETFLHAFIEWGTDCFYKFNGMFACAIYDPIKKKIFLARDRFGEKPLFFVKNSEGFAFASEIVALKLWSGFKNEIDSENIQRFFSWNYLPGARTIYKDCQSLQPGSWLCLDIITNKITIQKYWDFKLDPNESLTEHDEPKLIEELRHLLLQAVKRRLISDVPLGIFLSGGIDSSCVLASACKFVDPNLINTFTIGFEEKSYDESYKAKKVAEYLKVNNKIKYLTQDKMSASIDEILSKMSEPFGDASLIPTFHLSKFAREYVKVALTGDGGDELFAGYDPLEAIKLSVIFRKFVPAYINKIIRNIMNLIPTSDKNMSLEFKIKRWLRGLSYPTSMQIATWMSGLEPDEIRKFFYDPLNAHELFIDAIKLYNKKYNDLINAYLFFIYFYLSDDILVKSDRASMMVSLETRAVFLDNDIVDFCAKLPMKFKYRNGQRKYLLKKALKGWLPQEIIEQPKKGFGIPLNLWLRSLPETKCNIPGLKPHILDMCYKSHNKRKGDYRYFLWDVQAYSHMQ